MERLQPLIITIFGATGDLTHRKLLPALYMLYSQQLIPDHVRVYAIGRRDWSEESTATAMQQLASFERPAAARRHRAILAHVHYRKLPFDAGVAAYQAFGQQLDADEGRWRSGRCGCFWPQRRNILTSLPAN